MSLTRVTRPKYLLWLNLRLNGVFVVKSAPNMKSSRVLKGRKFSKFTEIGRMGSVLIHKVG